jgi:hypothetical protein
MELGMPPAEEWDWPARERRIKFTSSIYLAAALVVLIWIMSVVIREW